MAETSRIVNALLRKYLSELHSSEEKSFKTRLKQVGILKQKFKSM